VSRALRLSVLVALVLALIPAPAGATDLDVSFEVVRVTPVSATIRATISGSSAPLQVAARVDDYRGKQGPAVQGLQVQAVERVAEYRDTPQYETQRIPIAEKVASITAEIEAMRKAPAQKGEDRQLQEEAINGKENELAALNAQADLGATFIEEEIAVAHRYDLRYRERLVPVATTNEESVILLAAQSWAEPPPATLIAEDALKLEETAVNWGHGTRVYEYTVQTDSLSGSTSGILVLTINGKDYYDDTNSSWWDSEWPYRMPLTFDAATMTTDLVDFTTTVFLTPDRFRYDLCQPSGNDIRFVDSDGTPLPYEVDTWVADGTSVFHVLVPHIPAGSTDDYIWLYYGEPLVGDGSDAAAAWADHWEAVYHMADKPGDPTMILDSTVNGNHGTKGAGAAAPTEVAGLVGMAQEFVRANATYIALPDIVMGTGALSVVVLARFTVVGQLQQPISSSAGGGYKGWGMAAYANDHLAYEIYGPTGGRQSTHTPVGSIAVDTDYCLAGVADPSDFTIRAFLNGVQPGSTLSAADWGSVVRQYTSYIGKAGRSGYDISCMDGLIHELRISSSALSGDENAAIYMSLFDSFIDYGASEDQEAPAPEPVEDWTAAALLILLTFIALKERHIMTYTAAFLFLIMYGWTLGTEYLGLTICVILFAGYMLYQVSLSLIRRA